MFAFDKPVVWIVILVIVLLVFGAGKLPEIGKSLGRSIKEFKDETSNGMNETSTVSTPAIAPTDSVSSRETVTSGAVKTNAPQIRRRIIKHPDGREEIIEEPM